MRRKVAALSALVLASIGLAIAPQAQAATAWSADCPTTVKCVVVPAAYTANNGDVGDYGNYDITNRPSDMAINSIVIHDTEGSLRSAIEHFQDPTAYVSANYVIDRDGTIYQMVQNKNMTWHAGNWWYNMHSIGIEHVGYAADPASFTPEMYRASAKLVRYLAAKYRVPLDRGHIIGHDNVPGTSAASIVAQHVDPGPFWNWQWYFELLGAPAMTRHQGGSNSGFVTVAPIWRDNKQVVTGCSDQAKTSCVPTGVQSTNFVYLHTQPSLNSALITDPVIGQGSTEISNNAARLFFGQTVATVEKPRNDKAGTWYRVAENGTTGWLYSPWKAMTAFSAVGHYVTPKASTTNVAVYGRPIPERSEYPPSLIAVTPGSWYIPTPTPLPYTLKSGQKYTVIDGNPPTDHFYAWASDASFPYDHTVFKGETRYIEVAIGNRTGFVKASEVSTG